jgi:predicted hotdog family 3-hydroxylacyl-ACP dehydratase
MSACRYAPAELLPHRPPMILLDEIVSCDQASLVAAVTVGETTLFRESEGVPVHVGLEYMAQACGAYAGAVARDGGRPVRIGFLLGTRQYRAHVAWFRLGDRLTVSATLLYQDEQMGAFDCRIEVRGRLAAEAQLNVYQPDPAELSALGSDAAP